MKKKLLFMFVFIAGLFTYSVIATNGKAANGWGNIYEVEGPALKYLVEGVDLEINEEDFVSVGEGEDQIGFYKKTKVQTITLNSSDYSINPTSVRGKKDDSTVDNATYIDLDLNLTREQIGQIVYDEVSMPGTTIDLTKNLMIDVVVKYKWISVPQYTHYYNTNLVNDNIGLDNNNFLYDDPDFVEYQLPQLSMSSTNKQVINTAFYYFKDAEGDDSGDSDDDDDPPVSSASSTLPIDTFDEDKAFLYYTSIENGKLYAQCYNYAIFTNNEYSIDNYRYSLGTGDLSMKDENDTVVLFHDLDDINTLITKRKEAYQERNTTLEDELEEDLEDIVGDIASDEVEVPNTNITKSTVLIAISLLLIITGVSTIFVFAKQKRQLEN